MKITQAYIKRAYPNKILRRYAYRGNVDNPKLNELPLYLDEIIAYGAALNIFKEKKDYEFIKKIANLNVYDGLEELQKPEISITMWGSIKKYSNIFHFLNSVKKKSSNNGYLKPNDIKNDRLFNSGLRSRNLYERLKNVNPSLIKDYKHNLILISDGKGTPNREYPLDYDRGLSEILSESNIPLNSNKEKPYNLTLF